MLKKNKILLCVAPAIFLLDQATKLAVLSNVGLGERIPVVKNFFDIVHFRNPGAAFGMFSGMSAPYREPFFYIVAVFAVVLLIVIFRSFKPEERCMPFAVSLVFGGMAGNLVDRMRFGNVVDFLSFHWRNSVADFTVLGHHFNFRLEWPAFNVADSAITVAMFLFIYSAFNVKEAK
jgi:signal peptidase II